MNNSTAMTKRLLIIGALALAATSASAVTIGDNGVALHGSVQIDGLVPQ